MSAELAIVTNARAAGQQSMIGYGDLVLDTAHRSGARVAEWRALSALSARWGRVGGVPAAGKALGDTDRFVLTPLALAGRRATLAHVVDPGNVIYLAVTRHERAVCTVHDMIPHLAEAGRLDGFRPSRSGRRLMGAIRSRLTKVDRIACVSEATRRDLLTFVDIDPARVSVIPNAVFQPLHAASTADCAAVRRRLALDPHAPVVLHLGRNFYKNHAGVLDVFQQLARARRDVILVMVTPLSPPLAAAIRERGLEGRVHVVSGVARSDMAALYTTAGGLLFPSLYEGFGYPVLEAQLAGTPVVCSNAGALAEVAGDGARVFHPHDVAGMAAALGQVLEDGEARATLVEAGRRNAARFSRERWVAQHEALWAELGVTGRRADGTSRRAA